MLWTTVDGQTNKRKEVKKTKTCKWIHLVLTIIVMATTVTACTGGRPKITTATGLSVEENLVEHGIPAVIVPFDYPVPEGMIKDPAERQAMIEAKITHLEEINRLFWGDAPGTPEERQSLFEDIWSAYDQQFPGFAGLDLDWDAYYEEQYERMGQVESYGEFAAIITHMSYVLEEGPHASTLPSRLIGNQTFPSAPEQILQWPLFLEGAPRFLIGYPIITSAIGACVEVTLEDEVVVSKVWEGSPNPYHLTVGDEIIGYNSVAWKEWFPRLETADIPIVAQPTGAETARRYWLLRSAIANAGSFETINIRRVETGTTETLDVVFIEGIEWLGLLECQDQREIEGLVSSHDPSQPVSLDDDPMFVYGVLPDKNVGYMTINYVRPNGEARNWAPAGKAFAEEFEQAILSLMDTEGLIIDLRVNSGGNNTDLFDKGLAHLVQNPQDEQVFQQAIRDPESADRTRLIDVVDVWSPGSCYGYRDHPWVQKVCEPYRDVMGSLDGYPVFPADEHDLSYGKPIIVMTGPDCRSAGDILVQFLSFFPEFTIIGRDPNGILMGVYGEYPKYYLDPSDYVIASVPSVATYFADEGPPHHISRRTGVVDDQVWYSREDITNGEDTVLDYAFQLIREAGSEGE
jgi:hypothetical protein